jgi:hypothetical protein
MLSSPVTAWEFHKGDWGVGEQSLCQRVPPYIVHCRSEQDGLARGGPSAQEGLDRVDDIPEATRRSVVRPPSHEEVCMH